MRVDMLVLASQTIFAVACAKVTANGSRFGDTLVAKVAVLICTTTT